MEAAKDFVQGFFHELLEKKQLKRADPELGRFRSFLLTYFRSFISNELRKERVEQRGGGRVESLDALLENAEDRYRFEPGEEADPAKLYDQIWIIGLVERAMQRLGAEFGEGEGEGAKRFAVLRQFLPGKSPSISQAKAGTSLGLSENAVNQAVFKMRRRLREILHEDLAQTCASPEDFEKERPFILSQWSG